VASLLHGVCRLESPDVALLRAPGARGHEPGLRCIDLNGDRRRGLSHNPRDAEGRTEEADERSLRRLVARAEGGDGEAMRQLYVCLAPDIKAYVSRLVVDRGDAEDVTQQVFAKLLTELRRYQPREAPFRAWALRVARNVAIDHLRRARPVPCDEVHRAHDRADEMARERRACLQEALSSLTAGQRDVLVLRHLVGLTPEEIAARLGRSVRSVHCLHHRGRAAACTALRDLDSAPATVNRLLPPLTWPQHQQLEAVPA
jgi:RNA polymerase sigma-70 factor (ECF subfamily)